MSRIDKVKLNTTKKSNFFSRRLGVGAGQKGDADEPERVSEVLFTKYKPSL